MSSKSCETTHQSTADAFQGGVHPQFDALTPQLPPEILDMVANLSSFEGLTSLVRLNRHFYRMFNKLLYQNITIHSALQLFELSQSENVAHNLSGTQRMSIMKPVFFKSSWKGICGELKPAECLCDVLEMTLSLRELSLDYLNSGSARLNNPAWDFEWLFRREIRGRAISDSSFLSHLTRLQCPSVYAMLPALIGRPIESISHPRDSNSTINRPPTHLHPLGASPTRLSISVVVSTESPALFRSNYFDAIRVLKRASNRDLVVKHLKVSVVGSRSETWVSEYVNWPIDWIEEIALAGGIEHLESLDISFDPPLERNPMKVQERALRRAVQIMPNLVYAVVGSPDVQWNRYVGQKPSPGPSIPDWTPRPNCKGRRVRRWWLKSSRLFTGKVERKDVQDILIRLRSLMLTRWDVEEVLQIEWFHQGLGFRARSSRQIMGNAL
ncbi:hypothetical protein FRC09_016641 [Ceratobasidium sp. 395]|nr:hypothetical protein FRC09_016641 [Ceratobasidium sp. 395]